jgi:hypothetical protein
MTHPTQLIVGSTVTAVAIVLLWCEAPVVPSLVGALAASLFLLRANRQMQAGESPLLQQRSERTSERATPSVRCR